MRTLRLEQVTYLPEELAQGVLYVSEEYRLAGHLCACGCGQKVITPLGPAEWTLSILGGSPTLNPSVGNWQLPCRSHYWIRNGQILWQEAWSDVRIEAGRQREQAHRESYYAAQHPRDGLWQRFIRWLRSLF